MKELKNKIYELEGLLELADMRPEKFDALKPLIDRRIDEIKALWSNIPAEDAGTEASETEEPEEEPLYLRPDSESVEPKPEPKPIQEPIQQQETALPSEKRIALCLNDRFRFTRILGMGDKGEFERRLSRLANAGDFETARDYIVDECCLDPDDADVADLIEIVKTYYEQ